MLADFSFMPPDQIFAELKKTGSRAAQPAAQGAATPVAAKGPMAGMARAGAAGKPDLNDVKYDAFLANDRTLADPEVIKVEPGGRVLLRIINSSSMSAYHIDLCPLDGELIAVDGFPVTAVRARSFPIAVAQRLDIRLAIPRPPASYPVLAVLEGERKQSGILLVAGNAPATRIPDLAKAPSPALALDLEGRLRALQPRKADRFHTLNLTGDMTKYIWSINNVAWNSSVPPLPVANGERVELVMVNRTGMPHPMHLHDHQFQVVEIDRKRFSGAVRDTVLVTPGRRVVIAFDAKPGDLGLPLPPPVPCRCRHVHHAQVRLVPTISSGVADRVEPGARGSKRRPPYAGSLIGELCLVRSVVNRRRAVSWAEIRSPQPPRCLSMPRRRHAPHMAPSSSPPRQAASDVISSMARPGGTAQLDLPQGQCQRHGCERNQRQEPEGVHIAQKRGLRLQLLTNPLDCLVFGLP